MAEDTDKQAQERVGCVLDDKWTLERLLGVGGMAAVYAAKHRNGARAAVKVLHPDLSRHKEVRERFLREGYAANRVEHPGAVKVLDDDVVVSGPESGTAYIVMELLEGQSLQERLERGPQMSELEFLSIAHSVLEVLEVAHAHGVVHRDLKPENLFLVNPAPDEGAGPASGGARVKVLDFGLARLIQGQAITSYGLALGTPSFMSPEQAAGRIDEIDGRTDLFALAATGFRIVTGRRIHEGANAVELVRKMANLAAPRVRDVRSDVSVPCARVLDRALEFRRDDRYENAAAMREDVQRAVAELEVSGPTQLALGAPPGVSRPPPAPGPTATESSGGQTTIELSEGDLREGSRPAVEDDVREAPRPATAPRETWRPPLQRPRRGRARPSKTRSICRSRARSSGPLAFLLLIALAGGGAKLWFHRRAVAAAAAEASTLAATPIVVPLPSASVAAPPADERAGPRGGARSRRRERRRMAEDRGVGGVGDRERFAAEDRADAERHPSPRAGQGRAEPRAQGPAEASHDQAETDAGADLDLDQPSSLPNDSDRTSERPRPKASTRVSNRRRLARGGGRPCGSLWSQGGRGLRAGHRPPADSRLGRSPSSALRGSEAPAPLALVLSLAESSSARWAGVESGSSRGFPASNRALATLNRTFMASNPCLSVMSKASAAFNRALIALDQVSSLVVTAFISSTKARFAVATALIPSAKAWFAVATAVIPSAWAMFTVAKALIEPARALFDAAEAFIARAKGVVRRCRGPHRACQGAVRGRRVSVRPEGASAQLLHHGLDGDAP